MSAKSWCITFWTKPNFSDESLTEKVQYGILSDDDFTKDKKIHWHSYIEFNKRIRITGIQKAFKDKKIKALVRQGTRDEARAYPLSKGDNYIEIGDWSIGGQGTRNDIKSVVAEMKEGKKLEDVMMEHPQLYCQYRNGFKDINAKLRKDEIPKWRDVKVIVLSGATGVGKTRGAMEMNPFKSEGSNLKWWCGYNGEHTLLIDEYNNDISATELINLLDGYPLKLQIKGGHTWANWTKVFITTNLDVCEFHHQAKEMHRLALFRRLKWYNVDFEKCTEVKCTEVV